MKLLIVEDEPRTREGIKKIIESTLDSVEITSASNGKIAYDLCQENDFDVIFTDIKMPVMTGLEFLNKIDKRNKQIVIISGYNDFEYAKEAIKNNVVEYLLKPVDVFRLKDLLHSLEKRYNTRNTQAIKKYLLEYVYLNDSTKESLANRLFIDKYYYMCKVAVNSEDRFMDRVSDLNGIEHINHYTFSIIDDLYVLLSSDDLELITSLKHNIEERITEDYCSTKIIEDAKEIYENFSSLLSTEFSEDDGNIIISTVKNYIEHNYMKQITLSDLCDLVYVHPTYLSKLFKKETEMTITQYILYVRIEKAKHFLKDPKYRIYEVASMAGFKDSKYFANVFKSETGLTPMEYKNSLDD